MSHKRFSKLLLVVLALALWAGTANAQQIGSSPASETMSYVKGGGSNTGTLTIGITDSTVNTYTQAVTYDGPSGANAWLTLTAGTGTTPENITIASNAPVVNGMAAGSYVATITLTGTGSDMTTATIPVTLTVTSPLSAGAPTSTSLTWVFGGSATQLASNSTVTISNTDTSFDTYTVVPSAGCPAWLTSAGLAPTLQAKSTQTDTLKFGVDPTQFGGTTTASITNCTVAIKYQGGTFSTITFTKLAIVSQPLLASAPTAVLSYNKGTSSATQATTAVTIKVASGTAPTIFNLDIATLPPWLSVQSGLTNNSASANSTAGDTVTFLLANTVAAALPTGNYSAQVGFYTGTFGDLYVPIFFQVANATASLTVLPSAQTNISYSSSMGTPAPTATLYSTDEPVPFTATCTVVLSPATYVATAGTLVPCSLNGAAGLLLAPGAGNVVNGTAFTWGYGLTATLDPILFAAQIGNTVTVTIAFTNVSPPVASVVYQYTIQPGIPTISTSGGLSPSSASAKFPTGQSLVVLVKGTNFIGPGQIATGSSLLPTQVWLGATLLTAVNASTAGSYVVLPPVQGSPTSEMLVTIQQAVFPAAPAAGKTASIVIGVANQTGAAAPALAQTTASLTITNSAVIYGMTSTASYVQPAVGVPPAFAPYELISIFGDNFGFTAGASNTASFDSFGKVVTPLTVTAAAGTTKATTLTVTFKDVATGKNSYTAPLLFANQNQINAIVPASVVGNQYVTVTAPGGASDGLFTVSTVAADPGIFTLASDGTGQGAIINADGSINGGGHKAKANDTISIYLTGLGAPDSTAVDVAPIAAVNPPGSCVAITNTTVGSPGLLQVVNLKVAGANAYTPPSPAWTNIDGAVMNYGAHDIIAGTSPNLNFPPCMATATIAVTFGPASNFVTAASVQYAGFVSGSIAGLYQINATLPASLTGSGGSVLSGAQPVSVTITPLNGNPITSPAGVTMIF